MQAVYKFKKIAIINPSTGQRYANVERTDGLEITADCNP